MKKNEISYSQAMARIEEILAGIDSPGVDIDTLGKNVKEATELIRLCKEKLRKTGAEIEKALEE